jgi:hypothetical protein
LGLTKYPLLQVAYPITPGVIFSALRAADRALLQLN